MKYTVFNIEKNKKTMKQEANKLSADARLISEAIFENEIDTQEIANTRHNAAMLEKDIEIAMLKGNLEVYKGL